MPGAWYPLIYGSEDRRPKAETAYRPKAYLNPKFWSWPFFMGCRKAGE